MFSTLAITADTPFSLPETAPRKETYRPAAAKPAPTLEAAALLATVERAGQGDDAAWHALIAAYQFRIAGFVYAMTGRSDGVEDLTQQVFIKMVRSLHQLHSPAQFEPWLFRLARNTCIDDLRRRKIRRIFLPLDREHEEIAGPAPGVDTEELDALRHALARVSPKARALLALLQEGRSHREMAELLSTTIPGIKARIHRARRSLAAHYLPGRRRGKLGEN